MISKKELAVVLSRLKSFNNPSFTEEQYATDSEIAAEVLWFASLAKDISGRVIADLGAGTGILGIGCILLGAKKVHFVEKDKSAVSVLEENIAFLEKNTNIKFKGRYEIITKDISLFNKKVEVVIENPPFGTKIRHADREFLMKAFSIGKVIYSFHKSSTLQFVEAICSDSGFGITHTFRFSFPLKKTQEFHRKKVEKIDVLCFRFVKEK
jgi:putative methylase